MSEVPGLPCLTHACRKCCFDTEMPLAEADAARLEGRGFRRSEFARTDDGWLRLQNRRGRCVFLGPSGCTVHDDRPEGCRLYPLVWDADERRVVLDVETCPFTREFRVTPTQRAADEEPAERKASPARGERSSPLGPAGSSRPQGSSGSPRPAEAGLPPRRRGAGVAPALASAVESLVTVLHRERDDRRVR